MRATDARIATAVESSRTVFIVSDDAALRRHVAAIIALDGFRIAGQDHSSHPTGFPIDDDGALLVLLRTCEAAGRLKAVGEIAARAPAAALVVSMPSGATGTVLRRAVRAGADGIVFDDQLESALAATVRAVAAGQLAVPHMLGRRIAPHPLSHREKEILALVVLGYTNRQIADKLFVAESTVKSHLSSAFGKLDTRSRSEAAALILDPDEDYGIGIVPFGSTLRSRPNAESGRLVEQSTASVPESVTAGHERCATSLRRVSVAVQTTKGWS